MGLPKKYLIIGALAAVLLISLMLPGGRFEIRPPLPEKIAVKAFFSPVNIGNDCAVVLPVERQVPYTPEPARAALQELLLGPLGKEVETVATNIPGNVQIKSFSRQDGIVKVDFGRELGEGVAGNCRAAAIRSQIEKTLTQFPEIESVVISIEGKTAEILQP